VDLEALYARACSEHPKVSLPRGAFEEAWTRAGVVNPARAADVLIAEAISRRDSAALSWLQLQVQQAVLGLGRKVSGHLRAEVESEVLQVVAVGAPERPPRIQTYAARGPLRGWLHVLVARTAQARAERPTERLSNDEIERAVLEDLDRAQQSPELDAFKSRFRGMLAPALRAASRRIDGRARTLIAMHYLDSVTLEEIARAYEVHRATAARWLADAREAFLDATRDELAVIARVPRAEIDSMVRLILSQLDVSLRQVIAEARPR
jgi:RNA polymerase sigma-70 factor, ECF subfamily